MSEIDDIRGRKHCYGAQAEKDFDSLLLKLDAAEKRAEEYAGRIGELSAISSDLRLKINNLLAACSDEDYLMTATIRSICGAEPPHYLRCAEPPQ